MTQSVATNSGPSTRVDLDLSGNGTVVPSIGIVGGIVAAESQRDRFHHKWSADQKLAVLQSGRASSNRTIRRLRIDTTRSVSILLDYTDTIGPQQPNTAEYQETLIRFEKVVASLQTISPIQSIYLWGSFPIDLRVQANTLARTHPKLKPSFLSPEKVAWIATSNGVTNKRRLSRHSLETQFAEKGLTETNIILIDNGGARWPFHLAGLAQVVVPAEKNDGIIDCVEELGRHLEMIYAAGDLSFDDDSISPEEIAYLQEILRLRIEKIASEGKTEGVLRRMSPRIHTRDIRDFLHPDRIRFIAADDALFEFVDQALSHDGKDEPAPEMKVLPLVLDENDSSVQPTVDEKPRIKERRQMGVHPSLTRRAGMRVGKPLLLHSPLLLGK